MTRHNSTMITKDDVREYARFSIGRLRQYSRRNIPWEAEQSRHLPPWWVLGVEVARELDWRARSEVTVEEMNDAAYRAVPAASRLLSKSKVRWREQLIEPNTVWYLDNGENAEDADYWDRIGDRTEQPIPVEEEAAPRVAHRQAVDRVLGLGHLTDQERAVCAAYLEGASSQADVGRMVGLSRQRVAQLVEKIRDRALAVEDPR